MLRPLIRHASLPRVQRRTLVQDIYPTERGIRRVRRPDWNILGKRGTLQQPSSSKALEIQRRLTKGNEHPSAIIRGLDYDEDLPLDVLILLLRALDARLCDMPRHEQRKAMLEQPMAGHLLVGIWSHEKLWRNLLPVFHAQELLCDQAVAEGLDHFIVDWVSATTPPKTSGSSEERWRGPLLRALMAAHLSSATDHSADRALEVYLAFHHRREEAIQKLRHPLSQDEQRSYRSLARASTTAAQVDLSSALYGGGYAQTSGELWDSFASTVKANHKIGKWGRSYNYAYLALMHPTRVDTSPGLQFLDEFFPGSDSEKAKENMPSNAGLLDSLRKFMHTLSVRVRSSGIKSDAERVERTSQALFGKAAGFRISKYTSNHTNSRHARQESK